MPRSARRGPRAEAKLTGGGDRAKRLRQERFLRCLNQLEIADSGHILIGGGELMEGRPRASSRAGVSNSGGCAGGDGVPVVLIFFRI